MISIARLVDFVRCCLIALRRKPTARSGSFVLTRYPSDEKSLNQPFEQHFKRNVVERAVGYDHKTLLAVIAAAGSSTAL